MYVGKSIHKTSTTSTHFFSFYLCLYGSYICADIKHEEVTSHIWVDVIVNNCIDHMGHVIYTVINNDINPYVTGNFY